MIIIFQEWDLILESLTGCLVKILSNLRLEPFYFHLHPEEFGKNTLIQDISRPTTFKIRYMVDNQKMFRVSRLKEHFISEEIEEKLINEIRLKASKLNGIIISDFNYGVITERVLNEVMIVSKKYNLPTFADCQSSSQIGDVSKFRNINLLTAKLLTLQ